MDTGKLRLQVITPDNEKYNGDADMVVMYCITGDMGILPGHEASSAILDQGILRIINDGEEMHMAVFGGIAQVRDDIVTVLASDAQWPEDIDRANVEMERAQAENRLRESVDDAQIQRERVTMRRTFVQIEVSSYPLLTKSERAAVDDGKKS